MFGTAFGVAALVSASWLAQVPGTDSSLIPRANPRAESHIDLGRNLRLLHESLRVPFGDDWGGQIRGSLEFARRISVGAYMKSFADGVCDPHWCANRAVRAGVDVQIKVTPVFDVNVGYEAGVRGSYLYRGPTLRMNWKF
jgi:hypothetical protein